ncbi:MAG: excisionase family DNA-binding protein [Nitrospirota bacterium]
MLTSRTSERLLTVAEAATRLGLKISTIRRRILERRIAVVRIGRAVRIPIEVVDALIADGWDDPLRPFPR